VSGDRYRGRLSDAVAARIEALRGAFAGPRDYRGGAKFAGGTGLAGIAFHPLGQVGTYG